MSNEISVINASALKRLPIKKTELAVSNVFKGENISRFSVIIVYLDDAEIQEMNKKYLEHDYVTDVISFLIDKDETDGEIYIGAQQAQRQADEYGVSITNEILRLAAHGALHLAGYDDATPETRAEMHKLENKYISEL